MDSLNKLSSRYNFTTWELVGLDDSLSFFFVRLKSESRTRISPRRRHAIEMSGDHEDIMVSGRRCAQSEEVSIVLPACPRTHQITGFQVARDSHLQLCEVRGSPILTVTIPWLENSRLTSTDD